MLPNAEQVFVRKLDQLGVALSELTRPSVIDAAGLCWELLMDERPLVHQANRELRLPIRFEVNVLPTWDELAPNGQVTVAYAGLELAPTRARSARGTRIVSLSEFLSISVIQSNSHVIDVRSIISFAANKAGGRHFDGRADGTRTVLKAIVEAVDDELPVFPNTLHAIGTVAHVGLRPIRDALAA